MILQGVERAIIKTLELGSIFERKKNECIPSEGLILGMASHPYDSRRWEKVFLPNRDRLKHLYILGATGSGKTKLIEYLIRQDILAGRGFCLLDAHGDLCNNIMQYLAFLATSRESFPFLEYLSKKLILIEPFTQQMVVGFNPLELRRYSSFSQTAELMGIFKKIWHDAYWGPRMEELLRNTFITLSENGLTLLEAARLLTDSRFREKMIEGLKYEDVRDYWLNRYHSLSDKMQAVYREPILNRLSVFIGDPCLRLMLGQARSTIDFREIMDEGKWLIINLSKGQLRENSHLLGALLIAKLKLAAMTRAELPERTRLPFYGFIDEFQYFVGEDFETILSEARKYGLGLTMAHQNMDQIDLKLKASILGNVGTHIIFRLSHHDALQISREMDRKAQPLIEKHLIDFKVGQAYVKLRGEKPRLLRTINVSELNVNQQVTQLIKEISFANFARPKRMVEEEIMERQRMFSHVGSSSQQSLQTRRPRVAHEGNLTEGWNDW
jgi:hypothetical protein